MRPARWRPGWPIHSLRVRVTLWYLGILLAVLIVFGAAVYVGLGRGLRAESDHALEVVAAQVIDTGDRGEPELDADALPPGYVASLHDTTGTVLASAPRGQALPWDPDAQPTDTKGGPTWRGISLQGQSWRVVSRPVLARGNVVAVFQVARSEAAIDAALAQLRLLLFGLVPLALASAGAVGLFLAGRALDPIECIARTAESIGAEDLARRLPETVGNTPDEVGRLAGTFNHMLDRLEGAFNRQRQFTADASHELRTPLTLLLTQLDVTLARSRDTREYQQAMRGMREDVVRLQRLVSSLLTLARADAGHDHLERRRVDLGDLAEAAADAMSGLAQEHGVRLVTDSMPDVLVLGDEARLSDLVVNLVQNAITYTPAGGTVTLSVVVECGGALAVLAVSDTGIGIAAEHLPHLFERFYRVDAARSSASAGTGLGLAIAQSIAGAHGGRLDVESQLGQGTTFTLRLPRATRAAEAAPTADPERLAQQGTRL